MFSNGGQKPDWAEARLFVDGEIEGAVEGVEEVVEVAALVELRDPHLGPYPRPDQLPRRLGGDYLLVRHLPFPHPPWVLCWVLCWVVC